MPEKQRKLFCEINPFCYALSTYKEIADSQTRGGAADE